MIHEKLENRQIVQHSLRLQVLRSFHLKTPLDKKLGASQRARHVEHLRHQFHNSRPVKGPLPILATALGNVCLKLDEALSNIQVPRAWQKVRLRRRSDFWWQRTSALRVGHLYDSVAVTLVDVLVGDYRGKSCEALCAIIDNFPLGFGVPASIKSQAETTLSFVKDI